MIDSRENITEMLKRHYFDAMLYAVRNDTQEELCMGLHYVNMVFGEELSKEEIDKILHILIDNGKGIEVNTSGYAKGMNGPNPCKDIILEYKKLGGEILTIGSDAHKPTDIAADYDKAEALIKECGFDHYYIFNQRKPEVMRF